MDPAIKSDAVRLACRCPRCLSEITAKLRTAEPLDSTVMLILDINPATLDALTQQFMAMFEAKTGRTH